jgi:hypothetical protein
MYKPKGIINLRNSLNRRTNQLQKKICNQNRVMRPNQWLWSFFFGGINIWNPKCSQHCCSYHTVLPACKLWETESHTTISRKTQVPDTWNITLDTLKQTLYTQTIWHIITFRWNNLLSQIKEITNAIHKHNKNTNFFNIKH